ncbi:uncharacterized protein CCDC197 isoform X1 [Monodelphis domestica]|nr:uncharacterized protein CCDC197 isoform X1 [Monodelphis domestica]
MEVVAKGKTELLKGQKYRNLLLSKLLVESKAKKQQALERLTADVKINKTKQEEIDRLTQELRDLRNRKQELKKKLERHRHFEDFLAKVLDKLPSYYRSWDLNSSIKKIIEHHEMLSKTNTSLKKQVSSLSDAYQKAKNNLEVLQLEHKNKTLILTTELSKLQKKLDDIKIKNKQLKARVQWNKDFPKDETQDLGCMLTVISHLAEQCKIEHYGPIKQLDLTCKMDMIQEFILDKMMTQRLAESRMLWTGETITDYRQKIQGQNKGKLRDNFSYQGSSRSSISKITIPQENEVILPMSQQSHCLKPLNLPKSKEVQNPVLSFPRGHSLGYPKPTPCPSKVCPIEQVKKLEERLPKTKSNHLF